MALVENDYPTKEQLQIIRDWPSSDLHGLMWFIKSELWHWPDYIFENENGQWELHTGGWSGNEEIIAALDDNLMFWMLHWYQSARGGHYLFGKPKLGE
jgi:hypothetical protein